MVTKRSKTFSSCGEIPIIIKDDESFMTTFIAPPKLLVSSIADEKLPFSDPLYEKFIGPWYSV